METLSLAVYDTLISEDSTIIYEYEDYLASITWTDLASFWTSCLPSTAIQFFIHLQLTTRNYV